MGFKKSEMTVSDGDQIAAVRCFDCDYKNGIPPDPRCTPDEPLWCGGCGRILGKWSDAVEELYGPADRLLAQALARKPAG